MIDQLAKQLFSDLKHVYEQARENPSESQVKAIVSSALRKLNLVTREEFDIQAAVLLRTREKIDLLEKQVSDLEQLLAKKTSADKSV